MPSEPLRQVLLDLEPFFPLAVHDFGDSISRHLSLAVRRYNPEEVLPI